MKTSPPSVKDNAARSPQRKRAPAQAHGDGAAPGQPPSGTGLLGWLRSHGLRLRPDPDTAAGKFRDSAAAPDRKGGGAVVPARRIMALMEEYETRLMYSADLAATGLTLAGAGQVSEQRVVDSSGEFVQAAQSMRHELLIVGAGIEDSQTLLEQLAGEGREIDVLVLDAQQDSIGQITAYLNGRHDLDAIHILSHGAQGELALGGSTLDAAALTTRAGEIASWSNALNADADLLLYGCDVAAGDLGLAFVAQLASLTGSDVAASNDLTGDLAGVHGQAGNWVLEVRTGHIETANVFSAAARQQWTGTLEVRVNSVTQGVQSAPAVAVSGNGSYVVTWTSPDVSGSGIMMQRYNANGTTAGTETQVNTTTAGDQVDSAVAMASNGSFVVVWSSRETTGGDTSGTSIQGQRFNADGTRAGTQFLINQVTSLDQELPAISMADNGQFVVAWQNSDPDVQQVVWRRFSATGAPISSDIVVDASTTTGQQQAPAIVLNNSGTVVVTWQSNAGASGDAILARMFGNDDNPLGEKFRVNTQDSNDQRAPSISADLAGNFVIAWTTFGQGGYGQSIAFQRFNAAGDKLGGEIGAGSSMTEQSQSGVAMTGDGYFNLIGSSGDTDGLGIGRVEFYPDGLLKYGPVLTNNVIAGDQSNGAIAVNRDGAMVVVWQGNGYGDTQGIFLRKFQVNNDEANAVADTASVTQTGVYNSPATGVLANDNDKEGNALSVVQIVDAAGQMFPVPAAGVTVSGLYGSLFIRSNGSYTYTASAAHIPAGQSRSDVFTYDASDGYSSGTAAKLTITITGSNDTPQAADDTYTIGKNGTISFGAGSLLANDKDPDGDTLVVSAVGGVNNWVGISLLGAHGTFKINADGSFSYKVDNDDTFVKNLVGSLTLTDWADYTIRDPGGAVSTATLTIIIRANSATPDVVADTYNTQKGAVLSVNALGGVLANDHDDDADDKLHALLYSGPANGSLTFSETGAFVYTPNAGFSGTDAFYYTATDGYKTSAPVKVTLNVAPVNHAPVAVADQNTMDKGSLLTVPTNAGLLANDSDPDGSSTAEGLRVTSFRSTSGGSGNSVVVNNGLYGTVTTTYGTLRIYSNGEYSYTANGTGSLVLAPGQISNDIFSYTITDSSGSTSTALLSFAINGSNTAPLISGTLANQTTTDKASIKPFAAVVISDAEGQDLTVTVAMNQAANGALATSGVGTGTYNQSAGTWVISGTAAEVTVALRALVFTPAANRVAPGTAETTTFTITVSDGIINAVDATTTVLADSINDAPFIDGANVVVSTDDRTPVRPFGTLTFTDADRPGQQLTAFISFDLAKGTLDNLGGFVHDTANGGYRFTGTADEAQAAIRALLFVPVANRLAPNSSEASTFSVRLTDAAGASTISTVPMVLYGLNDAPVISNVTANQNVNANQTIRPFASTVITDADLPSAPQTQTVTVTLGNPANGVLVYTGTGPASYDAVNGVFTFSGTASAATAALQSLVFKPTEKQVAPGNTVSTLISLRVDDGIDVSTASTTVHAMAINSAPVITGASNHMGTTDRASVSPFYIITISDADVPAQSLTLTVTLDDIAKGWLDPRGTGSYDATTGIYSFTGTAAEATLALRGIVFTPTENRVQPGTAEISVLSIRVSDGSEMATEATTSVTSTSVNDAPVISGQGGAQQVNDNATVHPFATMNVSDADRPGQQLTVTVTMNQPGNGSLSGGGGTYSPAEGKYTVSGTASEVSTALKALVFTPIANRVQPGSGETTVFTVLVSDGQLPASDSSTSVTAISVNDAPVITGVPNAQSAMSDRPSVTPYQPYAAVVISDADRPDQQLTVTISLDNAAKGRISGFANGSYDSMTGLYTVSGTASEVTAEVRALVFTATENRIAPGTSEALTLTIRVSDGSQFANVSSSILITSINDAPVIGGTLTAHTIGDDASALPFAGVIISDADNPGQALSLTVTLSDAAMGRLSEFTVGSYDVNAGIYLVSGTAAEVNAALHSLRFTPRTNHLQPGDSETVVLRIDVSDGTLADSNAGVTVTTTSVNDAPTITGVLDQTVDDNASLFPFAGVLIADADFPQQVLSVTVTLENPLHGTLVSTAPGLNPGSENHDAATGVYTVSGSASVVNAALHGLRFTPAGNRMAPGAVELTGMHIHVSDGNRVADASLTLTTVSINDAPLISGTGTPVTTDDRTSVLALPEIFITDADRPGQILQVTVTLDLAARGSLGNGGSGVGNYDAATGIYTFTGTAGEATAALRALVFTPAENRLAPGSTETTSLQIEVSDGLSAAVTATARIMSLSLNDAPVLSGLDAGVTTGDDQSVRPFSAVRVTDADRPGQTLSASVMLDRVQLGTLTGLSGGSYDRSTGIYTVSGSAAQVTAALRALVFVPVENRVVPGNSESAGFTLRVGDGISTAVTGSTSIAILSINNAPVATPLIVNGAVNQGRAVAITLAATDVDDGVASFTIVSLPANGVLSTDAAGTRVLAAGARIAAGNNASTLYFTATENWGGTTQFSYLATDQSGASSLMQAVVQLIMVAPTPNTAVGEVAVAPRPAAAAAAPAADSSAGRSAQENRSAEGSAVKVAIQDMAPAPQIQAQVELVSENTVAAAVQTPVERIAEVAIGVSSERSVAAAPNLAVLNLPATGLVSGQAAQNVFDTALGAQNRAALDSSTEAPEMIGSFDQMRETAKIQEVQMDQMVESSVAASTAVTVGYVLWLLRGGVLAASMLSALPAWRFVDPLPVMGGLKNGDEGEDDSLEKLVEEGSDLPERVDDQTAANATNKLEKES